MGVNDDLYDDFVRHQFDLERVKVHIRNRIFRLLSNVVNEIAGRVEAANLGERKYTEYQRRRFSILLKQVEYFLQKEYTGINKLHTESLRTLGKIQTEFLDSSVNGIIGSNLTDVYLSANQLAVYASDSLIDGAPSKDWWSLQKEGVKNRFERTIRSGLVQQETNQELVKRIRGTASKKFKDGIGIIPKKHAEALVRTSVQTVVNQINVDMYKANQDVIKACQQQSTLDNRTTVQCIAYSGKQWRLAPDGISWIPIGHSLPFISKGGSPSGTPRHWSCRSTIIPIVKSYEELRNDGYRNTGGAPSHDVKKQLLDKIRKAQKDRDLTQFIQKTQSSMDGQVAADLDFFQWSKSKSPNFLQGMIGKSKSKLLQSGQLTPDQLVDMDGLPLSLEELRKRLPKR